MSPKELLYIEDALGHETQMRDWCRKTAAQMTDPALRSFVEGLAAGHDEIYGRIRGLLQ